VLEGSVRKDENRIRITVQLIDAIKGHHLWAEQYEAKLKDIFAVQDDITKKIITALQVQLTHGETAQLFSTGTKNLEAYLKFLQGLYHHQNTGTKEGAAISQKLAEEAISADPNYPAAYYLMALALDRQVMLGSSKTPKISLQKAIENAQKAISLDDSWADPHAELGWLYTVARQHEKGVTEAEYALALNPSSTDAWLSLGLTLNYAGKHEEAIKVYRKGMRLSPVPSATQLFCLCVACRDSGRYEEGISSAKEAIRRAPNAIFAHTCLASCYALLGRNNEAQAEGTEVLRIDPNFSLARLEKVAPYKDQEKTKLVISSLQKAGLK
jgi:adenylate cyclase